MLKKIEFTYCHGCKEGASGQVPYSVYLIKATFSDRTEQTQINCWTAGSGGRLNKSSVTRNSDWNKANQQVAKKKKRGYDMSWKASKRFSVDMFYEDALTEFRNTGFLDKVENNPADLFLKELAIECDKVAMGNDEKHSAPPAPLPTYEAFVIASADSVVEF